MPANVAPLDLRNLLFRLPNAIFAQVSSPEFNQTLYQAGRMGLTDGNQRDLLRVSSASPGGSGNTGSDLRKSAAKTFRRVNIRHHGNLFDPKS
jgi:hypothetical protein